MFTFGALAIIAPPAGEGEVVVPRLRTSSFEEDQPRNENVACNELTAALAPLQAPGGSNA